MRVIAYAVARCKYKIINYMFRPLIGHQQVVFNLSSNYTIYPVYSGGEEIHVSATNWPSSGCIQLIQ